MKSLSSVGLGLSLVFGCLLLALAAELYYLFWWKKRITNGGEIEYGYSSPAKEFFHTFCWKKKPSSSSLSSSRALNPQELCSSDTHVLEPQNLSKDLWHNQFDEESIDAELLRLQHLSGPPRFLFTIKEETKEDLESEDGRSRGERSRKGSRSRSLTDFFHSEETPYSTPIASPSYFTPPLTPIRSSQNNHQGLFSLFEAASDAEFNRLRSSPPPTFQFLRDAEDKLVRKKLNQESERGVFKNDKFIQTGNGNAKVPSGSVHPKNEENGSLVTIIVNKNREREHGGHQNVLQYPSSSSQVLPLATSPPKSTSPTNNNNSVLHEKPHQLNHQCN